MNDSFTLNIELFLARYEIDWTFGSKTASDLMTLKHSYAYAMKNSWFRAIIIEHSHLGHSFWKVKPCGNAKVFNIKRGKTRNYLEGIIR